MLTPPGTFAPSTYLRFINSELARNNFARRSQKLALALLASTLILAMAACGSAVSNHTPPPPPGAPTVASFSPTSGAAGTIVVLTGTNFTGATSVQFNGHAAETFAVGSATHIAATVSGGTTTGAISVTTSGGTGISSANFTVADQPTITTFAPGSGVAGNTVTITGTNFTGATSVKFNGNSAASFTVNSAMQITATVANGTTTGKITVSAPGGSALSSSIFTITNVPTISSFSPASGVAGTAVTITGTNLTGATAVKFNSTAAASFTVNSGTQITATVAIGTTTGSIMVTTPVGSAVSASNFTMNAAPPTITALNPGSGPIGTPVVITGTNFTGATVVAFNGKAASAFTVNSATQITATVATGSTTGKVTVTTPSGTATSSGNFTVSGNATLDLSIEGLYITQATQEYPNPIVPLVQNRSAWVRVFVKANQANTATPTVKVDFVSGGVTVHSLTINAGGSSVPLSIDPENAAASWNAAVDKSWIVPSTQVVATVDPTNLIPEADETNNTFSQSMNVQNLKPWKVTLIPVHTADGNTGTILINGSRTLNDWVDFAKRIHPVPDAIDVIEGTVLNSSVGVLTNDVNVWGIVLNEVTAKQSADNATNRYYYGVVHPTYSSGIAGLGSIGAPSAIGWDANGSFPSVFAHEEGHNFNRAHSPCGGAPGPDPNYPYPGAIIGVPGWDVFASSNNLKGSAAYTDIMAYCSPQWISDYVYVSEYNFRLGSPIGDIVPDVQGAGASGDALLIWGRIRNGQVTLEPAFRIPANQSLATPGPYTWEAHDAMGHVLASVSFTAPEVADSPDDAPLQIFSFVVPLKPEVLAAMQTMNVKSGNQELARRNMSNASAADFQNAVHIQDAPNGAAQIVWDADRYPVLMLRDAKTGEVRGFVRGGNAQIEGAPKEILVHAPDGARSEVIRHQRVSE